MCDFQELDRNLLPFICYQTSYINFFYFHENPWVFPLLLQEVCRKSEWKPTHFNGKFVVAMKSSFHYLSVTFFLSLVINRMIAIGVKSTSQPRRHAVFQTSNPVVVQTPTRMLRQHSWRKLTFSNFSDCSHLFLPCCLSSPLPSYFFVIFERPHITKWVKP